MEYSNKVKELEKVERKLIEELASAKEDLRLQKEMEWLNHYGLVKHKSIVLYGGCEYLVTRVDYDGWVYGHKKLKNGGWHKNEHTLYTQWEKIK